MDLLLEVNNIKKTFCKKDTVINILNGISFFVKKGEFLGIVGESGCGKTTAAKIITRLIPFDSGNVFLEGKDISKAKGKELKEVYSKVQMVFQMPFDSFNPRLTLGESIMEGMKNQGMKKKAAKEKMLEILKICGLSEEYAKRFPHEVSGGQCQRAAIARAVAVSPKLIVCDEATSALDVTVQRQIIELLFNLKNNLGISFIFICHDIALVQKLCDRVIVMNKGNIVEEGKTMDVLSNPKSEYTKRLLESVL